MISPRFRISQTSWRDLYKSRRDLGNVGEMEGYLAAISPRFRISQTSWRNLGNLGNLGEMEDISPQSRRDLESNKHHEEILARSQ